MTGVRHRVLITPAALADLDDIAAAIGADSAVNAARFVGRLRAAIARLDRFPLRGTLAPEGVIEGQPVRQLLVGEYRVLYIADRRTVVVSGVRHMRRLPLRSPDPA